MELISEVDSLSLTKVEVVKDCKRNKTIIVNNYNNIKSIIAKYTFKFLVYVIIKIITNEFLSILLKLSFNKTFSLFGSNINILLYLQVH